MLYRFEKIISGENNKEPLEDFLNKLSVSTTINTLGNFTELKINDSLVVKTNPDFETKSDEDDFETFPSSLKITNQTPASIHFTPIIDTGVALTESSHREDTAWILRLLSASLIKLIESNFIEEIDYFLAKLHPDNTQMKRFLKYNGFGPVDGYTYISTIPKSALLYKKRNLERLFFKSNNAINRPNSKFIDYFY